MLGHACTAPLNHWLTWNHIIHYWLTHAGTLMHCTTQSLTWNVAPSTTESLMQWHACTAPLTWNVTPSTTESLTQGHACTAPLTWITSFCCFTWFTNSRQLFRSIRKSSHNNYQDLYTLSVGTKQTRAPVGCQCRRFKMATRWGICSTGLIANDFCSALKSLPSSEHEVREARWRNVEFIVADVCCQSVTIAMRKTRSWRVRLSAHLIDCRCSAGVWSV